MDTQRHELGMIGLGVMGRNMLLNMADHGFPVADDFPNYAGGTWGPDATQGLLVQQGHSWPAPAELTVRPKRENS